MEPNVNVWSYLAQFFLEREMFPKKLKRKSKLIVYVEQLFFSNLWGNVEKYGRAGQVTDDNNGRPDHDQQHCYHHAPTVHQRLILQLSS